jgi:hypothetical protein
MFFVYADGEEQHPYSDKVNVVHRITAPTSQQHSANRRNSTNSDASSSTTMNGFPLTIRKQPSGETFWIHVEPNYRISTCKQKIQRMRGIPGDNIRLGVAKESSQKQSEHENENASGSDRGSNGDDFQHQTLESLGLIATDAESESEASNGMELTLDISPITLYVQTPTGRRIKLKASIDVEATVDGIEEMVTRELESAHLLETSESSKDSKSNEERFRLYHGRMPLRRGSKITKYKIKHMDVLKLKFGTEEASASQKEERKKAFQKSEAHQQLDNTKRCKSNKKPVKRSPSAENLRHMSRTKTKNRALSSSPIRNRPSRTAKGNGSCSANETVQQQQQRQHEAPIRKILRYCSSERVLKKLSRSLNVVRSSSSSSNSSTPLRGAVRSAATPEEEEPSLPRNPKARRSSAPAIVAQPRSRSGSAGKKTKERSSLKKKSNDEETSAPEGRRRSHSSGHLEGRRKKSRSKSRSRAGRDQTGEPRRRKKKDDENEKIAEQRRRRSLSSTGRKTNSYFEELQDVRSSSNKSLRNNSPKSLRSSSSKSRRNNSNKSIRSNSGSRKKSAGTRRTRARSTSNKNTKKSSDEGHPRKSLQKQNTSSSIQNNITAETSQDKKDDTPDPFTISAHKTKMKPTKTKATNSDEKGRSPSSPVSVVTETLNMSHLIDECSEGSSDIQSHETDISVFNQLTNDGDFKEKEMLPSKTTSTIEDEDKLLALMRARKEKKNKTNNAKANKNPFQSKRMSLQELKEAKVREEANKLPRVSQFNSKPDNFNTADFHTSSQDITVAVVDRDRTNAQERKDKIDPNTIDANKNTTKPKRTSSFPRNKKTTLAATKTKTDGIQISEDATEKPKKALPHPPLPSIVSKAKAKFEKKGPVAQPNNEPKHAKPKAEKAKAPLTQRDNSSVVRQAKAKFEKESTAPNPTMPERQHKKEKCLRSPAAVTTKSKVEKARNSSSGVTRTKAENQSVVRLAKAKFEKENQAATEKNTEDTAAKPQTRTVTPKRRRKSRNSKGLPEKVMNELKDTLHLKADKENATVEAESKQEKSFFNKIVINAPTSQANERRSIRSLRPSLKDTPSFRNPSNGSSTAKAAAEATAALEKSIENENTENSTKPQSKTIPSTNSSASTKASIRDRIRKFQTEGEENANATESANDGIRKIHTGGKENVNAKVPKSVNDRIKKFQTGGKENANASGFQMIGLQTLGLKNVVAGTAKKDDNSSSTTYSFFCSNDEESEYEDSDSSDSEDDSSFFDEFDSIHVIGPDLVPFEIQIDSNAERLGDIKEAFSVASGIPVDELRFAIQSEESDIKESYHVTLEDDFRLTPGDILAVQPSTVVVKLPDGHSKLELSVFPGTLLSDIKDYIEESTGTTPSRQLLYNFEKNFNDKLEDDTPISTDCTLRLTVY